jgi:Ca-activated chloride channel family protein
MSTGTNVRPRRAVGSSLVFVTLCLLVLGASCAGGSETRSPTLAAATQQTQSSTTDSSPEPPRPPADVVGAAERPNEPEIPADVTPLTARLAVRHVPIPDTSNGHSTRFTFDGGHRGWFARMPEYGHENPLTPVYGHDRVYVGGGFSSHTFYAYDARTGELDWRAGAPDGGPSSAIVEGDKVLYNTESCTLFAVDAETGRQRWSHWLGDPLMGQPAANDGRVFSGHIRDGGGYGFTAMRISNGEPIWTRDVGGDVLNAPVLDDESVFVTTLDGVVHRFAQSSGRVIWTRRLHATSAPWLHGDTVHVTRRAVETGADGHRHTVERAVVLSQRNGETIREMDPVDASFVPAQIFDGSTQSGWAFEGSRPTIVDGRSYQTIGNEVHCRNADTGELLWRREYTDQVRTRPASSPAIAGAQLVFGTSDGALYGLDIDTGMTTWAYDVGEPITSQPTIAHGWVYASTTRGGVVALEVSDDTLDGWHMWGGNARHAGPVVGDVSTPEEENRPSEGSLTLGSAPHDGEVAGFPLESTRVSARVTGFVSRVTVEQTFHNPYARPVEAVYLFPLPEDSAVDSMTLRAGDRVVEAHIERREVAREQYRDARERGVLASLLEQERPNLFRQSVANIRPGDSVSVTLTYVSQLAYEDGSYRFTYPLVAGPRYVPQAEGAAPSEADEALHQVVLAPGGERPDRVEVSIDADLGTTVSSIESPTHTLTVERDDNQRTAHVTLAEAARPDRDLEVRFVVAGAAPTVSVLASPPSEGHAGTFAISLHPSTAVGESDVTPRELVFLVDTSSSMSGRPMALAQAAVERALHGMRETDTFRVLGFSDTIDPLSDAPLPATADNVARAVTFVRGMRALGASEMVSGIRAALSPAGEDGRLRMVLLLTDGYIGTETDVFRAVHETLGQARLFAFGVGSAVNRYLLTRVAEEGRGDVQVVLPGDDPAAAADAFSARIARPYVTDVSIDWGGLAVSDVYPRRLPDLFADRPLRLSAHYGSAGTGNVTIHGRIAGRAFTQTVPVSLPSWGEERPELTSMWARARIGDLTTAMVLAETPALVEQVTTLGLEHHLLTDYTAFIAIDEGYHVDGQSVRVEQATQLPDGVEVQGSAATQTAHRTTATHSAPSRATGSSAYGGPMTRPSISVAPSAPSVSAGPPRERMQRSDGPPEWYGGGGGGDLDDALVAPDPAPQPELGRGRSGVDCYALATRADGSIDQDALAACLEAQGAGMKAIKPGESESEGEGESESEGETELCAWCIEP